MSLMMLSMVFVMITLSLPSIRRIKAVLIEESSLINPENPIMTVDNGEIEFKEVSFKYSSKAEKNALSNIMLST